MFDCLLLTVQEREEKLNMAKKLILVWLILLMVLFSSISIYADENVQGDFFVKHVVINGEEITNYNLQYPFVLYGSSLYFPLTPEMGEICGVYAEMDWESHTLKLLKTDSTRENISSNWLKNNNVDLNLNCLSEAKVLAFTEAMITETGEIDAPILSAEYIDLGGMPVLYTGGYCYLPVRAMTAESNFNWDIYFDPYYGVCISTNSDIPAESYCNKEEALRNQGLVGYMCRYNPSLTPSVAQNYLFYFKRAAEVYSIDENLLIAMAHKESTFNAANRSRSGAVGLMQIMPSTGARYGLSVEQLLDPYINIGFGAMYISERIAAYNGDWEKGLSAYNQGSRSVNRGTYSTAYASRIMTAYYAIDNYLNNNGFIYHAPIEMETELTPMGLE